MAFFRLGKKKKTTKKKNKTGRKSRSSSSKRTTRAERRNKRQDRRQNRKEKRRKRRGKRKERRKSRRAKMKKFGSDTIDRLLTGEPIVTAIVNEIKDEVQGKNTLSSVAKAKNGGKGSRHPGLQASANRRVGSRGISSQQTSPLVSALANRATGIGSVLQNKTPAETSPYVITYLGPKLPSPSSYNRDSRTSVSSRKQNPFAGQTSTLGGFASTTSLTPSAGSSALRGRNTRISTSAQGLTYGTSQIKTQEVSIEFPADLELRKTVFVYSVSANSSLATSSSQNRGNRRSSGVRNRGNTRSMSVSGRRKTMSPNERRAKSLNKARSSASSSSRELIETITVTEQLMSTSTTLEIPVGNTIVLKYEDGSVLDDFNNQLPSNYYKYDSLQPLEKFYLRDFIDQGEYILDVITSVENPIRATFSEFTKMYQSIQGAEMMSLRSTTQEDYSIMKADWDNAIIPSVEILSLNASSATGQWTPARVINDESDTIVDADGTHKAYRAIPVVDDNYIFDYDQTEINEDETQPGCTFTCVQASDNGTIQSIDIFFGDMTNKTPMLSVRIEVGGEVLQDTIKYIPTTYSSGEGNVKNEQMVATVKFDASMDIFDVIVRAHADTQKDAGSDFVEYRETMITYPALYSDKYKVTGVAIGTDEDGDTKATISLKIPFGDLWVPKDQKDPYNREEIEEAVRLRKKVVSLVVTRTEGVIVTRMGPFMINGNMIQQVENGVAFMTFGDVSNAPNIVVERVNQSTGECIVSFKETEDILAAFDAEAPVPDSMCKYYYNLSVDTVGVDYCLRHAGESITRVMTATESRRKKLYDPWVFEHPLFLKHNTHPPKRQDQMMTNREHVVYSMEPNHTPYTSTSTASTTDMKMALTIPNISLKWLYSVEEKSSIFLDIMAHPYLEIEVQAEMGIENSCIWAKLFVYIGSQWVELAQFHPQENKNLYYDYFSPWWFFLQKECLEGTDSIVSDEIKYQVVYYTRSNPAVPYTNEGIYTIESSGQLFSTWGAESAAVDSGLGTKENAQAAFLESVIGSFSPQIVASSVGSISMVRKTSNSAIATVATQPSLLPTSGGFNTTSQSSVNAVSAGTSASSAASDQSWWEKSKDRRKKRRANVMKSLKTASARRGGIFGK